jgi:hypothetical protein
MAKKLIANYAQELEQKKEARRVWASLFNFLSIFRIADRRG